MGATVSKIRGSLITRPMQRFNIDARTDKLLAKEKPLAAPKFESDQHILEEIRKERPEIAEAATKKDSQLLGRLKDVYVSSKDPQDFDVDINRKVPFNPERPMPGKGIRGTPTSGFSDAAVTSSLTGKLNIDDLQDILSRYSMKLPSKEQIDALSETHR